LKNYNNQIGQRMQKSDEWNAELQNDNIKLESEIRLAKARSLRNTIIAAIAGIVLGLLIPLIIKLLRTFKVIPI
jgi:capsular polysaccharide biosynthesis protein